MEKLSNLGGSWRRPLHSVLFLLGGGRHNFVKKNSWVPKTSADWWLMIIMFHHFTPLNTNKTVLPVRGPAWRRSKEKPPAVKASDEPIVHQILVKKVMTSIEHIIKKNMKKYIRCWKTSYAIWKEQTHFASFWSPHVAIDRCKLCPPEVRIKNTKHHPLCLCNAEKG